MVVRENFKLVWHYYETFLLDVIISFVRISILLNAECILYNNFFNNFSKIHNYDSYNKKYDYFNMYESHIDT